MGNIKNFIQLYFNAKSESKTHVQAIKFMLVGLANTSVDVFFYFALTRGLTFFSENIITARTISFLIASLCSFFLNKFWTFKNRNRPVTIEIAKFYITVIVGLIIGVVSMQFFIQAFHIYDIIALLISVIFTFLWNFSVSKLWVFKK